MGTGLERLALIAAGQQSFASDPTAAHAEVQEPSVVLDRRVHALGAEEDREQRLVVRPPELGPCTVRSDVGRQRAPTQYVVPRHQTRRVVHRQRIQDARANELLSGHLGDGLDQDRQRVGALIAVVELRAGFAFQVARSPEADDVVQALELARVVRSDARERQTAGVGQQVLDRDLALAVDVERRQVLRDRVVQADHLVVQQHHDRGPDDRFRHRAHAEDAVLRHRCLRIEVAQPIGLVQDRLAVLHVEQFAAHDLVLVDEGLH